MKTLFEDAQSQGTPNHIPLAERMRPRSLDEVVGQNHLLAKDKLLGQAIESGEIPSLILWGPPGVGKTTLARLLADAGESHFVSVSAVLSGIKEVRKVVEEAEYYRRQKNIRTILFVDEIHRFNKAQQDAFLPHVESGLITLIGATTENPSFEVISPLISRSRVLVLEPLSEGDLRVLLKRALEDHERGLGDLEIQANPEALRLISQYSGGDARRALNTLEVAAHLLRKKEEGGLSLERETVLRALEKRLPGTDKGGEGHFNLISALHKSVRNSDPDATLYWIGRMLEAGEDPLYVARRLVRIASEDVGLADPGALRLAVAAMQAVHLLGMPEGNLALAEAAVYLALSPKSNSLYRAYGQVQEVIQKNPDTPVPLHLRNASTRLMKELGYGEGYEYAHDDAEGITAMPCLPLELEGSRFYQPTSHGFEERFSERLKWILQRKAERRKKD